MTWTININGHDDLAGEEKAAYEEFIVTKAREFAADLKGHADATDGAHVSGATATTNTTGSVNVLS